MPHFASPTAIVISAMIGLGCAGAYRPAPRRSWPGTPRVHFLPRSAAEGSSSQRRPPPSVEPSLAGYLRLALENNPDIRWAFERWQASVHRISEARRLPEPTIGFGYFVQSVETRVGPQRARLSLQQTFPWPTRLVAGADAASAHARAMQRRFEARALSVARRVESAYWKLWQIRTTRAIHREHLDVIRGLSTSIRGRISTGLATLAELQQTDLAAARIEDTILGMDEAERGAAARFRATLGITANTPLPTPDEPASEGLPTDSLEVLSELAQTHPMIDSLGFLAEASEATARAEGAERWPSFAVGADWIITDEAAPPGIAGSGQDALIVNASMRLPLWQPSYADSVKAAEADSRAHRAKQQALRDRARAELTATLADLRSAARRIDLHGTILLPQAETAYDSVLGSYRVGRGTVAQTLLSQRDLLELRIELERARAEHAIIWARLEEIVGRELSPELHPDRLAQRQER